jgi:type II secretion system protein N
MSKISKIAIYTSLFFFSFLFFLLVSFPYEVVKENIASEVSKALEVEVTIGKMSPSFPIGVSFEDVKLSRPGGKSATLKLVRAKVSILKMLIGRLGATLLVEAGKSGEIEAGINFGMSDLIGGQFIPNRISFEAGSFPIGELTGFLFDHLAHKPTTNPLIAPELKKLIMVGELNSRIKLSLNARDPIQSEGSLSLALTNSSFAMDDGYIPEQKFKVAQVNATLNRGKLDFAKGSGFQAQDVGIGFSGDISLKNPMFRSLLNLSIPVRLEGGIKEKFGILLEMQFLGGERLLSEIQLQVSGPLDSPLIQPAGT